jgi:hypothetical protein
MSSFGNHLVAQTINGKPVSEYSAVPDLNAVLGAGANANNQSITGVNSFSAANLNASAEVKSTGSLVIIQNDTNAMINSSWGTNHVLKIENLPTTDPLVAGQVYNNAGVMTISTGGGGSGGGGGGSGGGGGGSGA